MNLEAAFKKAHLASTKLDAYFKIYDEILAEVEASEKLTVVELGVLHGGSLEMWSEYFAHRNPRVIGIDKNPASLLLQGNFEVYQGDQTSSSSLTSCFEHIGLVDLIIDDGAHTNLATVNSFLTLYRWLRPGGLYIIEDVHTSFQPSFGNPSKNSMFRIAMEIAEHQSQLYLLGESAKSSESEWFRLARKFDRITFLPSMIVFRISSENRDDWRPTSISNNRSWRIENRDFRDDGLAREIVIKVASWTRRVIGERERVKLKGLQSRILAVLASFNRFREMWTLQKHLAKIGLR